MEHSARKVSVAPELAEVGQGVGKERQLAGLKARPYRKIEMKDLQVSVSGEERERDV